MWGESVADQAGDEKSVHAALLVQMAGQTSYGAFTDNQFLHAANFFRFGSSFMDLGQAAGLWI